MSKIIVIDGNSLLFRAYYATYTDDKSKLMTSKSGVPTNALFAFSNMIASLLKDLKKDDGIFVAFDAGKHTFRHQEYKDYKANRPPCPQELLEQIPLVKQFLTSLNITYYEDERYEADDIAGNIAKKAANLNYDVKIYTSDKDYLQLIDNKITVNLIKKGLKDIHEMTEETFKNEWGFLPTQIVDYKGLMGDPSDNLKGIPKIGDKTAKKLIIEFGSLENIIANAPTIKGKLGENILLHQDEGKICKHLAIIKTDDELNISINDLIYKGYNLEKIVEFCKEFDLKTLVNKLPTNYRISLKTSKVAFKEISSSSEINIPKEFGIALDIEKNNYHDAQLFGVLLSFNDENYYINKINLLKDQNLLNILALENYRKVCFDFKKIKYVLNNNQIEINGIEFDLLLASYLLNSNFIPTIDACLASEGIDVSYAINQENLLFEISNPLLSAIEAFYSLKLKDDFIERLKSKNQYDLLINIEQKLSIVLSDMELEGFPINKNYLLSLGDIYKEKIHVLTNEIYLLAGEQFNISSPKQVATILYDKLKLNDNKHHSTSIEYLKYLVDDHPIIPKILEYRKYTKLLSTYVDGLLPFIKEDNKIHATFNQAITSTGRLSSSEPNLQNITVRDDEAKQIRKAFYYDDPSLYILSLDYSQIELRILAHLSNSKTLIDVFNNNEDIHTATARKVFHVPDNEEVNSNLRRKAKAVNFGIIYGISDWGLSEQLEISIKESREIILSFYENFPEIKNYLNSLVEEATTKGYAETMFNRRRYLPELQSSQYQAREFAKRAAMNAPIQGSAADLIKISMIKVHEALKKNNLKSKIVSQIHDEIILKVSEDEKDTVLNLVKDIMENSVKLKVKLKVDGGYARTWFDAK